MNRIRWMKAGQRLPEWATGLVLVMLSGCGGGGGSPAPPPPPPAPTVSLTASASDIARNGSVTLTWSSTNANSCTASGGWSGALSVSGSQSVAVASTATYTLTCSGGGGAGTGSVSITAWDQPAATISADATSILQNNSVALTWTSQNATSCAGGAGLSGSLALSGVQTSAVLTQTTTFSISCLNPAFAAVTASVTVNVSATYTLSVTAQYQVPGSPILDSTNTYLVPDWSNPVVAAIPFIWVELENAAGSTVQQAFTDANGVATFSGLDPLAMYTPVLRSQVVEPTLGLDFWVVDNTTPTDTTQTTVRLRYPTYAASAAPYAADKRVVSQSLTITAPDGWDVTSKSLAPTKRIAAPFAILASAVTEAQIISAAVGGPIIWRPLTILWSPTNKGGLSGPPNNFDLGTVIGSGGFWSNGHGALDTSGATTGAFVADDLIYLSGDPTFEVMDIYPTVMTHEMGHFSQAQFSTLSSPSGSHANTDYEDQRLAWIEGNASGIAAFVMNTKLQNRVITVSNELIVLSYDVTTDLVNGHQAGSPVGWFQENTVTRLMWELYDPAGAVKLTRPIVLAPMFTAAWKAGPWLNSTWAFLAQLKQANLMTAGAIDTLADSLNVSSSSDDVWGSTEVHAGNRSTGDVLPPYVPIPLGGAPISVCSVGAPLEFNKEGNVRYLRLAGDGGTHTLSATGPAGSVPLLANRFVAGSNSIALQGTVPGTGVVLTIGDCGVAGSEFSSVTAACNDPAPPAEQCWSITLQ